MPESPKTPPTFEQFLKKKAKHYLQTSKRAENSRAMTTVTLLRRLRAQSLSDSFGLFSPNGSNNWLGDTGNSTAFANMKSLNIIKPMVQLVSTTLTSAEVKLEIAASNKDPELGGAANIVRGLFEYWNGRNGYWDSNLKNRLAVMVCVAYGCYFRSYSDKQKHKVPGMTQPDFGEEMMPTPGKYACKTCGSSGPFIGEVQPAGEFLITQCPQCGKPAEVIEEPGEESMEVPTGESPLMALENRTDVINPLEIRLDERYSQNANIDKVQWLDWHPLLTEEEMKAEFGEFPFGNPIEWSFPMKWKHAMETGTVVYEKSQSTSSDTDEVRFWEVRNIYMRPDQYLTYTPPSEYEVKDAKGEVVDVIEPDIPLVEKYPEGFRYRLTGEKCLPGIEPRDLTQEWDYCGLNPDPMSFHYRPLVEWLQAQDDANTQYTIWMQHLERNAQVGIIYDDCAFDPDSFESDLIPTKEGFTRDAPIGDYFETFQTPQMNEASNGLQFIISQVLPLYGYQPAAVGERSPNEPYAAQLLQKQQALGQLAQAQHSQANAERGWFIKQTRLAQQWPPAKLEYIRTRLGEEWKEEDIEAFLRCDIERDLDIDVLAGSEIPTSLIEREVKLNNFMTQLGTLRPELVQSMPPEFLKEVFSQWLAINGIDADFDNTEAEDRLSTARYMVIKQAVEEGNDPEEVFRALLGGSEDPSMPSGGLPILVVLKRENHDDAIEFWTDHEMATHAENDPQSQTYVVCFEEMIRRHETAKTALGQEQTQQQMQIEAPAIEAQAEIEAGNQQAAQQEMEMKAAQAESQQELESTKIEAENMRTAANLADSERSREHEIEKIERDQVHQRAEAELQRKHDAEQQDKNRKEAKKEKVKAK